MLRFLYNNNNAYFSNPLSSPTAVDISLYNADQIQLIVLIKSNRYRIVGPDNVGSRHVLTTIALGHKEPLFSWCSIKFNRHLQDIEGSSRLDLSVMVDFCSKVLAWRYSASFSIRKHR